MSLAIGIVGLPNVGKSTLFQAITKKQVPRESYPFCTIDPNIGVVAVPDERVDKLAELTKSNKKIYTTIKFVDIAGLVKGANEGEGLGNQFLAHIREVDAIIYVLRAFFNERAVNVLGKIDILGEKEILDTEMALKDLATVEKRLASLKKGSKFADKKTIKEIGILEKTKRLLESGQIFVNKDLTEEEKELLRKYQLLTIKPRLYLLNGDEKNIPLKVINEFKRNNWRFIILNVLNELEILNLSPEERKELGLTENPRLNDLIKECYRLLDLITFFTTVSNQTQAWAIKKGSTVLQAAGLIHTDFQKHFVRAEVINWKTLLKVGGFTAAREKGLIRTEGRDYQVIDGDVIEVKANV